MRLLLDASAAAACEVIVLIGPDHTFERFGPFAVTKRKNGSVGEEAVTSPMDALAILREEIESANLSLLDKEIALAFGQRLKAIDGAMNRI